MCGSIGGRRTSSPRSYVGAGESSPVDEPAEDPYVGPQPFERAHRRFFFGRDVEARELLSLVVADRVVLLYAASGAGKSSLLNAGLIPLLELEEEFDVVPVARIRSAMDEEELAKARNVYMLGVLSAWEAASSQDAGEVTASVGSLVDGLAQRPRAPDSGGLVPPRALIFDQFEELFTLYPNYWTQRRDFFQQIGQALTEDPLLRVVLTIREDYLAQL